MKNLLIHWMSYDLLFLLGLWKDVSFILYIVKFICQILTIRHIFTNQEQFWIKSGYIHLSFPKYNICEYWFSLSVLRKLFQNCFNLLLAPSCFLWIKLASFQLFTNGRDSLQSVNLWILIKFFERIFQYIPWDCRSLCQR